MWKSLQHRGYRGCCVRDIQTKCVFTLTKVNVTKGTTPYLSPQPVLVPHSQLHGCELSLPRTEIQMVMTHDTMSAHLFCTYFLSLQNKYSRMSYFKMQLRTIQDGLLDFSEWLMEGRCPRGSFSCSHDPSARDTLNHVLVWVLPKQDWLISNSCLASRDTRLGLGGGGWLKWDQQEQRREEKEKQPNQGSQKCKMSLRNWDQLHHKYNNLAHTKRNEVHHLSCAARDAVPRSSFIKYSLYHATLCSHCKSKTKLSAVLWSTAKGGKAWAATELCPALSVSRPSDNFVQWTSSKVLQRNLQHWASFIKEMCFPATNL